MNNSTRQSGFTAVELLITLFVAAAFLIAGYQLFSLVIKDGGQTRAESRAANVAYDYMRRYAATSTSVPCVASTPVNNVAINVDGLSAVTIKVTVSCPTSTLDGVSKVEALISFNIPSQTLQYATFVTPPDITNGLVAWWPLDGNTINSISSPDGVAAGASLTTGQNGQNNTAYNTTGGAISADSNFGITNINYSVSLWVNNPTATNSGQFFKIGGTKAASIGIGSSTYDGVNAGTKLVLLFESVRWIPTSTDLGTGWHHVVMTVDSSGVPTAYLDSNFVGTYSGSAAQVADPAVLIGYPASSPRSFNGSVDDVRIYNRVLSTNEISSLYLAGAK